jgi:hypothetical protein
MKEEAIKKLEPLVPGYLTVLGYENLTVKYIGKVDPTLLVYNYIARPPYYWSEKLFLTVCNVKSGSIIEINASTLEGGMFGTALKLKLYDSRQKLIDETTIPTTYSCIDHLEIGDVYGKYEVLGFGEVEGISYQHYSYYALKVEDAMDHILRSINRDPRRGYGWWHQIWVWWCGYWEYRDLWLDDNRLDPQFGSVVFCEERWAAQRLTEVVVNCLHAEGVWEIVFEYIGNKEIDIEVYTLKEDWWNGSWMWIHSEYDITKGETFAINGSMRNGSTKLGLRTMLRVFDSASGEPLDIIYIRSSGEWPLEVRPGNVYGEILEIADSTLLIGDEYTKWHGWWGDFNWWDLYFLDFYSSRGESARCGWEVDDCYNPKIANEEKARVCSNLTTIWAAMELLILADKVIAMGAYSDAENMTVTNATYAVDYLYNIKQSKRHYYQAGREQAMGRPAYAITEYKLAWKYAILAMRFAYKRDSSHEFEEMYDECYDCYYCCEDPCYPSVDMEYPWWVDWYQDYCNWSKVSGKGRSKGFWKTNIGKHICEIEGKPQVSKADILKYLAAIETKYGDKECLSFLGDLTLKRAYEILCIPNPPDPEDKAEAQMLALLLNLEHFGDEYKNKDVYLLNIGLGVHYEGKLSGAASYINDLYCTGKYAAAQLLAEALNN